MTTAKKTAAKKTAEKKSDDDKPAAKKTAAKKTAAKKTAAKKPGLYANIHAKQERIAHGSGEHMREPGSDGAPKREDFDKAEKTAQRGPHKK